VEIWSWPAIIRRTALPTSAARTPRSDARWRSIFTASSGLLTLTLVSTSVRPSMRRMRAADSLARRTTSSKSGPSTRARMGKKFSPPPSADGIITL
jgi:hypothetical protein